MLHGMGLGLGLAEMGGKNPDASDDLKPTLFTESAVADEAAGFAVGLILLGTANSSSAYIRETQHKKIIQWANPTTASACGEGLHSVNLRRTFHC